MCRWGAQLIGCIVGTTKLSKAISTMATRRCTSYSSPIASTAKGIRSWRKCFQIQRSGSATRTQILLMGEWRNDYSGCWETMGSNAAVSWTSVKEVKDWPTELFGGLLMCVHRKKGLERRMWSWIWRGTSYESAWRIGYVCWLVCHMIDCTFSSLKMVDSMRFWMLSAYSFRVLSSGWYNNHDMITMIWRFREPEDTSIGTEPQLRGPRTWFSVFFVWPG